MQIYDLDLQFRQRQVLFFRFEKFSLISALFRVKMVKTEVKRVVSSVDEPDRRSTSSMKVEFAKTRYPCKLSPK